MYWTFVIISGFLILPITFFLIGSLFNKNINVNLDKTVEIDVLKNQLLQIERDEKSDKSDIDGELNKLSITRKILTLTEINSELKENINAPIKLNILVSVFIAIIFLFGSHLTYRITTENFFDHNAQLNSKNEDKKLKTDKLSQTKAEEIVQNKEKAAKTSQPRQTLNDLQKLVEKLENVLLKRPEDLEGHRLLVKNSVVLGDFITARKAQKRILELLGPNIQLSDYVNYMEFCIIAAEGYISRDALEAIYKVMSLDNENTQARLFLSVSLIQDDKVTLAVENWLKLLQRSKPSLELTSTFISGTELISAELRDKLNEVKKQRFESLIWGSKFLEVFKELERYLENLGGPIETWASLLRSYKNLQFVQEATVVRTKVKTKFGLSDFQVENLTNNKDQR